MAIIKILQYPDPKLKRVGKLVEKVDDHIKKIVDDMFETHYNTKDCAALAATQLDFDVAYKITVIDFSEEKNQPLCLINPEIIETEGEQYQIEGCMSVFPNAICEKVKRAQKIKVKALDREGKPFEMEAEGFMAKCIQHELDHLNGKVYLDRLSRLKRSRVAHKIQQFLKQNYGPE